MIHFEMYLLQMRLVYWEIIRNFAVENDNHNLK